MNDRSTHAHHIHIQMDVIHEDPDSIDIHTVQRRVWCLSGMDRRQALTLAQSLGDEINETQAGLADAEADAHRG